MDKNDTAVKVLVYQTLMQFASGMKGIQLAPLPWQQLLALAQAYHHYLNEILVENTSEQGIGQDAFLATQQLQALREVIRMKPESLPFLIQDVEQGIQNLYASVTL